MSFESSYKGNVLERDELTFTSELGWLAALAVIIVAVIAAMQ
jgi:hypothetical protein